ncbi:MAG: hypothetical protein UU37_C0004G0028 [Candidatus Gottesmanbacteria bacterium GW2011_GWA2_41_12]|uniref:Uncharacterized protein n=2 Tax=Candidatus Gottesmaniibacteriota TaxID=1752720 RepID=A0A0G0WVE7_9BACT|nr:MAG: hypothetical protein UT63_C0034G0006 [Candidatus Gottesmanbacteria bacterium GW2011_GWC2_39_8]KKR88410.1 MAG: hypothetical protein UU37_C0004G0028 [Candidatus Gottesmanbacteria bacterium GW2011_GWA2_41_12]
MSFLDTLLPKKEKSKYFLILQIGRITIKAVIWSANGNEIKIAGKGFATYDKPGKQIEAADAAILKAGKDLPENIEVNKVIFGIPVEYTDQNKIKKNELVKLKKLVNDLSLTPIGFIEIPEALSHYFRLKEGSPTTSLLVEVGVEYFSVSLLRVGKIHDSTTILRTDNPGLDLEKAFKTFTSIDILPSKIVLYDQGEDLEEIREELTKYPWQQKAAFLHFPKIEVLDSEIITNALVNAAASETTRDVTMENISETENIEEDKEESGIMNNESSEEKEMSEEGQNLESGIENKEEITIEEGITEEEVEGDNFGFVKDKDILEENITVSNDDIIKTPETKKPGIRKSTYLYQEPVLREEKEEYKPKIKLPEFKFKLPEFTFHIAGVLPVLLVIIFLAILSGVGVYAYWNIPTANVSLIVDPKIMDQQMDVTISPNTTIVDKDSKTIPGKILEITESDKVSSKTSGKKSVGDPATGEVTVYNKTNNSKSFKQGSIIMSSDNIKFTLNDDVTVASASDTGEGINFGKTTTKVTAVNIGPEGNLSSGTTFTFTDFPSSSYSAKNTVSFSHGTSREVSAVSQEDQDKLLSVAEDKLSKKAKDDLYVKLVEKEKLLEKSIKAFSTTKKFNKDVGDESSDLTLDISQNFKGVIYKENDLNELIKQIALGQMPEGYEFSPDKTVFTTDEPEVKKDGSITFLMKMKIYLLPKIDQEKIRNRISGKSFDQAQEYLKSSDNVVGVSMDLESPFPFGKDTLPHKPSNIKIGIATR